MIEYRLYHPGILDQEDWRDLQVIQRDAFATSLNHRNQAEIDALVDWQDPERYYESHQDPNYEVGRRFNGDQEYANPFVAVAVDIDEEQQKDELIGFGYAAYNVSGVNSYIRGLKKQSINENYFWLREMAVKPGYQRQRIGMHIARLLLTPVHAESPVTTYAWVDELGFLADTLNQFHLFPTGEAQAKPFGGEASEPVRQVRYQGLAGDIRSALPSSAY